MNCLQVMLLYITDRFDMHGINRKDQMDIPPGSVYLQFILYVVATITIYLDIHI